MKRGSVISVTSKVSVPQPRPALTTDSRPYKPSAVCKVYNNSLTIPRRLSQTSTASNSRRTAQGKQVSFVDGDSNATENLAAVTTAEVDKEKEQPVALTTKNLNMYNAMVLKTLRTAKFDDR